MVMDVHRLDTSPDHDSAMVCPGSVFDGVAVSDPDDALVQVGSPPPPPPPTGIAAAGGEPDSANAIKADTPTTHNRDRQVNTPLTLVALLNEPNMRTLPGNLDFHLEAFHPVPSRSPAATRSIWLRRRVEQNWPKLDSDHDRRRRTLD